MMLKQERLRTRLERTFWQRGWPFDVLGTVWLLLLFAVIVAWLIGLPAHCVTPIQEMYEEEMP